jgi:hypothetical protein
VAYFTPFDTSEFREKLRRAPYTGDSFSDVKHRAEAHHKLQLKKKPVSAEEDFARMAREVPPGIFDDIFADMGVNTDGDVGVNTLHDRGGC